jgi:transposase-like protein
VLVDETYVKVAGRWRYVYRAVDQHGQVVDVYVSARRDIAAARRFFTTALAAHGEPDEVVTDLSPALDHVPKPSEPLHRQPRRTPRHPIKQRNSAILATQAKGAPAASARPC